MAKDVPLVIPEVNPDHIKVDRMPILASKIWRLRGHQFKLFGNGLVLAPCPAAQALRTRDRHGCNHASGQRRGISWVASMDILGNVIPYIAKEEEKMEEETRKLLGLLMDPG